MQAKINYVLIKLVLTPLFIITCSCVWAQEYIETQNKIKSIYLYNFIKKIEWKQVSTEDFNVCLLEKNSFFDDFEKKINAKHKDNRVISVKKVDGTSDCAECDLIYIDKESVKGVLKRDPYCKSLVVTSEFYEASFSDIALLYNESQLQFAINKTLCEKMGFKIHNELLSLSNQKLIQP